MKKIKQTEFIIDIEEIKKHSPDLERIVIRLKPRNVSKTKDIDIKLKKE